MATVTLQIGADALRQLHSDLTERKRELLDLLDEINGNLDAVSAALRAISRQDTLVFSDHDPYKSYLVSKENGLYSCTCPSWEYQNGTDTQNHCKHIRRVIEQGRFN